MILDIRLADWKDRGFSYYIETPSAEEFQLAFEIGTQKLGFDIRTYALENTSVPPIVWKETNPFVREGWRVPDDEINDPEYDFIDGPDHWITLYAAIAKVGNPDLVARVIELPRIDIRADSFIES